MDSESTPTRQATDSVGEPMSVGLGRQMSELARELEADGDPAAVMQRIVAATIREIEVASCAGITLVNRQGHITAMVDSDEQAGRLSQAQQRTGQGPCLDTARDDVTLHSDDLRMDGRWPMWTAAAVDEGVLSLLSFQLFVESDRMGALEVYADQPGVFDAEAENTGLLLASHAAIALSDSRKVENLHRALMSRDVIGQAKGILMERFKINSVQAFDLLIKASQSTHLKLHEVAEVFATTGEMPTRPPRV